MGLIRDTPSNDTEQLDNFLWSYNNNFSSYGPDKPKNAILDIWPLSVTWSFDIGSWVIYATHLLMTSNNLTKIYEDTTITYQVMARTSQKMAIFDIWPLSVTLTFDIGSWVFYATRLLFHDTKQFDKVLWKYNNNCSSYGTDKPKNAHFWPLTSKCDLDLWHRVMGLIRDTPTHDTEQFDKVLWRYNNYLSSNGPVKP